MRFVVNDHSSFSALVALFVLLVAGKALAFDLRELRAPPQTQLSWVGQKIVHNGMPMQIIQLQSSLPVSEVMRFYREDWREYHQPRERATVTRSGGEWQMLSTLAEQHNVVVQLKREAGRTTGFLSAMPLDTVPTRHPLSRQFPRQADTELISSTESSDGGVPATTLILRNSLSLRANQLFYQNALQRNGWKLTRSNVFRGTAAMLFDGAKGSLELAIHHDKNATTIFANVRGEAI